MTEHTLKDIELTHAATDRILSLSDLLLGPASVPIVEYKIADGKVAKGECIVHSHLCAVQYVKVEANAKFPIHAHRETEWVIVLKGCYKSRGKTYRIGDGMYIKPQEPHELEFLEDTTLLAITVPASEAFPRPTKEP